MSSRGRDLTHFGTSQRPGSHPLLLFRGMIFVRNVPAPREPPNLVRRSNHRLWERPSAQGATCTRLLRLI